MSNKSKLNSGTQLRFETKHISSATQHKPDSFSNNYLPSKASKSLFSVNCFSNF